VRTVPLDGVEDRIDHMSITPDGRHLFVAALGNSSVEVVDVQAGSRAGSIGGIKEPQGVFFVPESKKLAVASGGDSNLRVYDEALKLVGTVDDLEDADNVRYDAQAKLLYVGYGSGGLAVIDPEKAAQVADIKLDAHPESFRLETNGNRIFVNVPHSSEIEVVDRGTKQVVTKWPLTGAQSNFPMSLDEEHHRLFIGCRKPAKMLVLDDQSGKTIAETDCVGDTDDLFYDAARKRIYISGGAGSITVVQQTDADHYQVVGNIKTASGARTSFFSSDTGELYLAVPHRGAQRAEIRVFKPGD
jgi:DNA-binding beta-propeller fold protein YncE